MTEKDVDDIVDVDDVDSVRAVDGRGTTRMKIEMRTEARARKVPKACAGDERCLRRRPW